MTTVYSSTGKKVIINYLSGCHILLLLGHLLLLLSLPIFLHEKPVITVFNCFGKDIIANLNYSNKKKKNKKKAVCCVHKMKGVNSEQTP